MCASSSISCLANWIHQRALFLGIGLAQHLVVDVEQLRVFVIPVVARVDRGRQIGRDIDRRVDDGVAIAGQPDAEVASSRSAANHGPVGTTFWVTCSPILLH